MVHFLSTIFIIDNDEDLMDQQDTTRSKNGVITRVDYDDEERGFYIFSIASRAEVINVTGTSKIPLRIGDLVDVNGRWVDHKSYGRQLQSKSIIVKAPKNTKELYEWIKNGRFEGAGQVTADTLYATFGEKLYNIVNSDDVKYVPGLQPDLWNKIQSDWIQFRESTKLFAEFSPYKISYNDCLSISRNLGKSATTYLKKNPWDLTFLARSIGFHEADKIAADLGLDKSSASRTQAGIIQALHKCGEEEGHVFVPLSRLLRGLPKKTGDKQDQIQKQLSILCAKERVYVQKTGGESNVYTRNDYLIEKAVAIKLAGRSIHKVSHSGLEEAIARVSERFKQNMPEFELTDGLQKAVNMTFINHVSVLTGGPGTGKTSTVNFILQVADELQLQQTLLAPTNLASGRLKQVTGREANTLHSQLKINPEGEQFTSGSSTYVNGDLLIVDEKSMVNMENTLHLLQRVSDKTSILFVGDTDQLPAIGKGNVLQSMIDSKVIPTTKLSVVHRTKSKGISQKVSGITQAANLINRGVVPATNYDDFQILLDEDMNSIQKGVIRLVTELLPRSGYSEEDVMVLTPMHMGPLGTIQLNEAIKERIRPYVPGQKYVNGPNGFKFTVGDVVMQNLTKEVEVEGMQPIKIVKGDIGRIVEVNNSSNKYRPSIVVQFKSCDDVLVDYDSNAAFEIVPAYVKTVHRAQGSESKAVVMVMHSYMDRMLERSLFYTGVTRGKECAIVVSDERSLSSSVTRTTSLNRNTMLADRIKRYAKQLKQERSLEVEQPLKKEVGLARSI